MSRDISLLHPYVRQKAEKLVEECKKAGLNIKITDCVRSREEQNGIDASRTQCKYPNSYHNWGVAFDICQNDKKCAYPSDQKWWKKIGAIGKKLDLEWGGDWKGFVDRPHFESHAFGTVSELKRKYGTPEKFFQSKDFKKNHGDNSAEEKESVKVWTSVVDYLAFKGFPHDFQYRKKLAKKYRISGYVGTASQNTKLLKKLVVEYGN